MGRFHGGHPPSAIQISVFSAITTVDNLEASDGFFLFPEREVISNTFRQPQIESPVNNEVPPPVGFVDVHPFRPHQIHPLRLFNEAPRNRLVEGLISKEVIHVCKPHHISVCFEGNFISPNGPPKQPALFLSVESELEMLRPVHQDHLGNCFERMLILI